MAGGYFSPPAFGQRDTVAKGKVQLIRVSHEHAQAQAATAELRRLNQLGVNDWSQISVLSSTHRELAQVRGLMEAAAIPFRWVAQRDKMVPLHHVREICCYLRSLEGIRNQLKRASQLSAAATEMFPRDSANPWVQFLASLLEAWRQESADAETPVVEALEFLYETCAESRREFTYGEGVTLSTVHSAKGTEHDHVLLMGAWPAVRNPAKLEESRRAFYVGMTRARKTLAVLDRMDIRPSLPGSLNGIAVLSKEYAPTKSVTPCPSLNYDTLALDEMHLGFPGMFPPASPIHAALARLKPGDKLSMRSLKDDQIGLFDKTAACVARLSHKAEDDWCKRIPTVRDIRVLAVARRTAAQDTEAARRERYKVQEWEVPVVEVVSEDNPKP